MTRDYVQIKTILPSKILSILYNSLILPYLQYCVLSWGFKSDYLNYKKEPFELLQTVSITPILNRYQKR